MRDCCEIRAEVPRRQRRVLWIVLSINAAMFLLEAMAGLLGHSTALLADSADMLGDAIVYGFSLAVVARGPAWQARAALAKGVIMAAFGAAILGQVLVKIVDGLVPSAEVMGGVGLAALAANGMCLVLLWRRRGDDVNMRSAWVCSLNDVVGNGAVLVAGAAVALTGSGWPDLLVGLAIAGMFGSSALGVMRSARRALEAARPHVAT